MNNLLDGIEELNTKLINFLGKKNYFQEHINALREDVEIVNVISKVNGLGQCCS